MEPANQNQKKPQTKHLGIFDFAFFVLIIGMIFVLVLSVWLRIVHVRERPVNVTKMAMIITLSAIENFKSEHRNWPCSNKINSIPYEPSGKDCSNDVYIYCDRLFKELVHSGDRYWLRQTLPQETYGNANVPRDEFDECTEMIDEYDHSESRRLVYKTIKRDQEQQRALRADTILDGWDRPMLYRYNGSRDGKPVLVSAGPDGRFGPQYYYFKNWGGAIGWCTSHETDPKFGEDDIRSDSLQHEGS